MPLRMIRLEQKAIGHGIHFRWNAILSGAFAMLGLGLIFLLLGNAIGLSVYNAVTPGVGGALQFWSWIYSAATFIFSYYMGAMLATRSNDIATAGAGALHGVISWSFASFLAAFFGLIVTTSVSRLFAGVGPNLGNWLAICVVGLGFGAAALGGVVGKKSVHYDRAKDEVMAETHKIA